MKDSINIEGRTLISSRRAAEMTKYANDYIGQLCRSGKVSAKMIGRNWFVDEESLLKHKRDAEILAKENGRRQLGSSNASVTAKIINNAQKSILPALKYSPDNRALLPDLKSKIDLKRSDIKNSKTDSVFSRKISSTNIPNVKINTPAIKKGIDFVEAGSIARTNSNRAIRSSYSNIMDFIKNPKCLMVIASIFTLIGIAQLNSAIISGYKNNPIVNEIAFIESKLLGFAERPFLALRNEAMIVFGPVGELASSLLYESNSFFGFVRDDFSETMTGAVLESPLVMSDVEEDVSVTAVVLNSVDSFFGSIKSGIRNSMRSFLGIQNIGDRRSSETNQIVNNTNNFVDSGSKQTASDSQRIEKPITTIINQIDDSLIARISAMEQIVANKINFDYRQINRVYDSVGSSVSNTTQNITESGTLNSTLLNTPNIIGGTISDTIITNSSFSGSSGIFSSDLSVAGNINASSSIYIDNSTPVSTTNRLYANTGDLYWAGSLIGGATTGNWTTDGTNAWRVTGNVGIGTTTPYSKLSVWGTGTTTARLFELTSSASTTLASFLENGTGYFAGNIGIGTTSPYAKLSIVGDVVARNFIATSTTASSTIASALGIGTTSPWAQLSVNPNGITGPAFVIGSSTATKFIVDNGGNVGIGTAAPAVKLTLQQADQVYAQPGATSIWDMAFGIAANTTKISGMDFKNFNSDGQVRLMARNDQDSYVVTNIPGSAVTAEFFGQQGKDTALMFSQSTNNTDQKLSIGTYNAGDLILGTSNAERMRILSTGNVGIGTTSPSKKLSVVGEGWFTSHLTAANITATGTLKMADVGNDLKFSADNTYDIGASAASRPKNVYIAGNTVIGGQTTLATSLTGLLYGVSGVVTASSSLSFDTTNGQIVSGGAGLAGALQIKPANTAYNWYTMRNADAGAGEGIIFGRGVYPTQLDLAKIDSNGLVSSLGAGAGFRAFNTGVAGATYGLNGINSFYTGQNYTIGGSGTLGFQTYAGAWLTRLTVANNGTIQVGTSTAHTAGMTLANGDLYVATSTGAISGVVLQASDASCHRITVDASNVISAATVTCP